MALKNIEICKGDVEQLVGTGLSRVGVIEHEMIGFGTESSP